MKRQKSNNSDSIKKKQRTETGRYDEAIKELVERKRLESFEVVSEENKINKTVQKCAAAPADSSEDDQEYDNTDRRRFKLFLEKEKRRTVQEYHTVTKKKLKSALKMLKVNPKNAKKTLSNEEKRLNVLKKHCSRDYSNISQENEPDHTWDSSMYILKNIRACILTRNWDNVTHLLLMLFKYRRAYIPFTKQVTLLNLMCNPEDYNGEILEEFFEMIAKPN